MERKPERKPYHSPQITRVVLRNEQSVLSACSTAAPGAGGSGLSCVTANPGAPTGCKKGLPSPVADNTVSS